MRLICAIRHSQSADGASPIRTKVFSYQPRDSDLPDLMERIIFVGVSPQYALAFSLSSGGLIPTYSYYVRPAHYVCHLNEVKNLLYCLNYPNRLL